VNVGAPELLIVLVILGIPVALVVLIVRLAGGSRSRTAASAPPLAGPPGWHPDPSGRFEARYFDGIRWTEHVTRDGTPGIDPLS